MKICQFLLLAPLFLAAGAVAQEPAAPGTAPATVASVSDDEVGRFAQAALAVERIAGEATLDAQDKKVAMAEVVRAAGFEAKRFNEIARASQSDAALQERILVAAQSAQPTAPSR